MGDLTWSMRDKEIICSRGMRFGKKVSLRY